jgi:hypothetical protein
MRTIVTAAADEARRDLSFMTREFICECLKCATAAEALPSLRRAEVSGTARTGQCRKAPTSPSAAQTWVVL